MSNPEDRQTVGHTPGPWKVQEPVRGSVDIAIMPARGPRLIAIATIWAESTHAQANAALIASAPDLLKQRDNLAKALERLIICSDPATNQVGLKQAHSEATAVLRSARATTGER